MCRAFRVLVLAALIAATAGCGSTDSNSMATPAPAPRVRIVDPQVVFRADPDLSDADAETLWATPGTVRVVVRLAVSREGSPSNVRIMSTVPTDLPVARAFAEAVVRSIPRWRFRPATRDGTPVDAELELTVEAEGEVETPQ